MRRLVISSSIKVTTNVTYGIIPPSWVREYFTSYRSWKENLKDRLYTITCLLLRFGLQKMKLKIIISSVLLAPLIFSCSSDSIQNNVGSVYPTFGPEIDVNIIGLSFDAMEPFISPDGNYLVFNNLNDGVNTKLYYATKENDSTFKFVGELTGTNQAISPHLDAVADMDSPGNFYWTSTRNYPTELDNLFHGTFVAGDVSNIGRVRGNFNKKIPGWLIMDHGISLDGQLMYLSHARLDGSSCPGVCETLIEIAEKVNDSTFNILANSASILENINDDNYIYYAPCISSDNLELYYTRYQKGEITAGTSFEICVAVRKSSLDNFSKPLVLFSEFISDLVEAPSLTIDKRIMYYHRKVVDSHKIVMRYRTGG